MTRSLEAELRSEPFTLAMSSGFFGFFAHTGMMIALEERAIRPAAITGSSAGALVGGAVASGLTASALRDVLLSLDRRDFWDPITPRDWRRAGYLRGELFVAKLESLLPRARIEDCEVPLAISAFAIRQRQTVVLSRGPLASAIAASCAVPIMFAPVLREGVWLWDGGIRDRPGLAGTDAPRVLYHHLTSRSPWRTKSMLVPPSRDGLTTLAIDELPRSGPTKLALGPSIVARARDATHRALDGRHATTIVV